MSPRRGIMSDQLSDSSPFWDGTVPLGLSAPEWAAFRYATARPRCPYCADEEKFAPPSGWYDLPHTKILIIRCGRCALDTIITVDRLRTTLAEQHLSTYGFVTRSVSQDSAMRYFVVGVLVGGVLMFLALL